MTNQEGRINMHLKISSVVAVVVLCGLAGTAIAQNRDVKTEEANKKMVMTFYQAFFGDHDMGALEKYLSPGYIQHNPGLPDGRDALANMAKGMFANAPKSKVDVRKVAADGDMVWLHVRGQFGPGPASSVVDIFRVKDGKIVEHWDTIQAIPDKSANAHPMF